jgi:hypothetical protein
MHSLRYFYARIRNIIEQDISRTPRLPAGRKKNIISGGI